MIAHADRFEAAISRFDEANSQDPKRIRLEDGSEVPGELLYARRMTAWLERLEPEASEPLRLAARCQHICRWRLPRSRYPEGRAGYRQWRQDAARMHAEIATKILGEVGYDHGTIERVSALLRKKKLKVDPAAQLLEDVICLVFLEHYFSDFASKHDEAKLVAILRKTWVKMSDRGRKMASTLRLSDRDRALVAKATNPR